MTPFGKFMRTLRLDKGKLLGEVADHLGVSSAYLSALEHGKKGVPTEAHLDSIKVFFGLNGKTFKILKQAVENSKSKISLPKDASPSAYETANEFARKLTTLSEEKLRRIREVLDK